MSEGRLQYLKSEYISLSCYFKSNAGQIVDVENQSVTIKKKSNSQVVSPTIMVPLEKVGDTTGFYRVSFLSTGLEATTYTIRFEGNPVGSQDTVGVNGEFALFNTPLIQVYIDELRLMLSDYTTSRYRLEDVDTNLWENEELYNSLKISLSRMKAFPPILSAANQFTFDNIGDGESLLIQGGVIYALISRAVLEVTNEFQYNDELSLAIQRAQKYQSIAQMLLPDWEKAVKGYKTNLQFNYAKPIGLKSCRMPMIGRFILSLLPHRQVIFGRY